MKIRNGFVSNSSSSSFAVTMKNGEKMTIETLLEVFDVKETSPIYKFVEELANWIIKNTKEQDIESIYKDYVGRSDNKSVDEMIEGIVEDYGGMNKDFLQKIANKEYRYYSGSACNDSGDSLESYICDSDIDIETDLIKIRCDSY